MSTLFRNKILSGLVILLLIANVATIVFFWTGMRKSQSPPPQRTAEYVIKELSLNDSQQKQYETMITQHRKQTKQIREQIRDSKDSLFDLLSNPNINDSSKHYMAAKISSLNQQLELLTFEHFKLVRKICNPDQQQKFDKIIKDVLRMMAAPAPHENRPPGPPPGERPIGPEGDQMPPPPGN